MFQDLGLRELESFDDYGSDEEGLNMALEDDGGSRTRSRELREKLKRDNEQFKVNAGTNFGSGDYVEIKYDSWKSVYITD